MSPLSRGRGTLRSGPLALGMLAPLALVAAACGVAAAPPHPHGLAPATCNTASPALIKQTLGVTVAAPRHSTSGKTLLCEYASASSSLAVVIQYNSASGNANLQLVRAGYDSNNEPTSSLTSLGALASEAFTASLGTGSLAEHSVVALQGKLQVVVASSTPMAKLVTLMRRILTVS